MLISDWSSDVCASGLQVDTVREPADESEDAIMSESPAAAPTVEEDDAHDDEAEQVANELPAETQSDESFDVVHETEVVADAPDYLAAPVAVEAPAEEHQTAAAADVEHPEPVVAQIGRAHG